MPRRSVNPKNAVSRRPPPDTQAAVDQVLTWMTEGNNEREIIKSLADQFPGVAPETVLTRVVDHFAAVGTVGPAALLATFGWAIEATKELHRRMVEIGDFVGAMRAVKQIKDLANEAATLPPPDPDDDDAPTP